MVSTWSSSTGLAPGKAFRGPVHGPAVEPDPVEGKRREDAESLREARRKRSARTASHRPGRMRRRPGARQHSPPSTGRHPTGAADRAPGDALRGAAPPRAAGGTTVPAHRWWADTERTVRARRSSTRKHLQSGTAPRGAGEPADRVHGRIRRTPPRRTLPTAREPARIARWPARIGVRPPSTNSVRLWPPRRCGRTSRASRGHETVAAGPCANAATSPGGVRRPTSVSCTIRRIGGMSVATTGRPAAM